MQDHFQSPFEAKFLMARSRQISNRPSDPYAVEPWEKSVVEMSIQEVKEGKNYKTFYPIPFQRIQQQGEKSRDRKYETQKQFSFRKQQQLSENLQKIHWNKAQKMTLGEVSCQSTISHYNINGNFLQEMLPRSNKKNSKQFILRSPSKQDKLKAKTQRKSEMEVPVLASNIELIKKRVYLSKYVSDRQDRQFVQLHADHLDEIQNKTYQWSPAKPKRKVISLGFRRFSIGPKLPKQRSGSLNTIFDDL